MSHDIAMAARVMVFLRAAEPGGGFAPLAYRRAGTWQGLL